MNLRTNIDTYRDERMRTINDLKKLIPHVRKGVNHFDKGSEYALAYAELQNMYLRVLEDIAKDDPDGTQIDEILKEEDDF